MSIGFLEMDSPASTYAAQIMAYVVSVAQTCVAETLSMTEAMAEIPTISEVIIPAQISTDIDFSHALDALAAVEALIPVAPVIGTVDENSPEIPALTEPPDITDIAIPDFSKEAPVLEIPTAPTVPEYIPPSKPEINVANVPERPALNFPDVPTLADVVMPSAATVEIPIFDETFIEEDLTPPSSTFNFNEVEYTSTLKTAVAAGLLSDIQNGGYGLNTADEQLLFDRARDREAAAMAASVDEATRAMAPSGFAFPPGILSRAIERARQDYNNKVSSINRDLVLKRADLYADFKKFTYAQAIALETVLINAHNAMMDRALLAARAQVEMAVAIFNALVARYNVKIEKFKVMAIVFETRVKAEIAKIEIFKAQVEAAKAQVTVNAAQVDLYRARCEAVKTLVEAYKVDVEAASIIMGMERLKMDLYRAETEAFVAIIQAKKMEIEAFEARVRGEVAKMQAYGEEARAYAAMVEGKKAQVEVQRLRLQQYVERNRAYIEIYKAQVEESKDIRDAQKTNILAEVEKYKAQIQAFDAHAGVLIKVYDLAQDANEKEYRAQVLALQTNVETVKLELERVLKIASLNMEAIKAQAETYRALAASALNAMNVNASLGDSFGLSKTVSKSQSETSSFSISHDYNYNP